MAKQASKLKGYDNIFAQRLCALMKERNVKQSILAEKAGCSRQSVSQYINGSSVPNVDNLLSISDFFDVSTDYLLGRTNAKTTDKDLRIICEYTGLSENTIMTLHNSGGIWENLTILHDSSIVILIKK